MKTMVRRLVLPLLVFAGMAACTPTVAYKVGDRNIDPASPGDKSFVFSLRNSSIALEKQSDKNPTASNPAPHNAGNTADKSGNTNKAATPDQPIQACAAFDTKKHESSDPPVILDKCFAGVTATAVATRDPAFYVADFSGALRGTDITVSTLDSDPFMVKSITVNYTNPAVGMLTSAAAGVTAGFAICGPYCAIAGGIITAGGQIVGVKAMPVEKLQSDAWYKNVCEDDLKEASYIFNHFPDAEASKNPQLYLPITVDYKKSHTLSKCWHPLPNLSDDARKWAITNPDDPAQLSGWFYRFIPKKPKNYIEDSMSPVLPDPSDGQALDAPLTVSAPFQKTAAFFATSNDAASSRFPVAACRMVDLQIAWWNTLKDEKLKMQTYSLKVADSDYIQAIKLPKKGTISLLPICDGYGTVTQTSSPIGEAIDPTVKLVQAYIDAQSKYTSSKTK